MYNNQIQFYLQKAADYCSKKETSVYDIKKKCVQWKLDAQLTEKIIVYLKENNYINHGRYANAYANDKWKFNHWGRIKIRFMLISAGIDEISINQALDLIDDAEYLKMIEQELSKKADSLFSGKSAEIYIIKQKLYAFGIAKGFESELIIEISGRLTDKLLKKK
jgi:regulatory protein